MAEKYDDVKKQVENKIAKVKAQYIEKFSRPETSNAYLIGYLTQEIINLRFLHDIKDGTCDWHL